GDEEASQRSEGVHSVNKRQGDRGEPPERLVRRIEGRRRTSRGKHRCEKRRDEPERRSPRQPSSSSGTCSIRDATSASLPPTRTGAVIVRSIVAGSRPIS